jgi:hypothetical protein
VSYQFTTLLLTPTGLATYSAYLALGAGTAYGRVYASYGAALRATSRITRNLPATYNAYPLGGYVGVAPNAPTVFTVTDKVVIPPNVNSSGPTYQLTGYVPGLPPNAEVAVAATSLPLFTRPDSRVRLTPEARRGPPYVVVGRA